MFCFIKNADCQALTSVTLIHYAWEGPQNLQINASNISDALPWRNTAPPPPSHRWLGFPPCVPLHGHVVPSAACPHVSTISHVLFPLPGMSSSIFSWVCQEDSLFFKTQIRMLFAWPIQKKWILPLDHTTVLSLYFYNISPSTEMAFTLGISVWKSKIRFPIPALPPCQLF